MSIRTPGVERLQAAGAIGPDEELDRSLRPRRLTDFVGQPQVRDQLGVFIAAARGRDEALDHVLLAGPPGLGKTSLAQIVRRMSRSRRSRPAWSTSSRSSASSATSRSMRPAPRTSA